MMTFNFKRTFTKGTFAGITIDGSIKLESAARFEQWKTAVNANNLDYKVE